MEQKTIDKRFDFRQIDAHFKQQLLIADQSGSDYTTILPPPNLTGALHIGHALVFTLQDAILRYQAQSGRNARWFAGTDHAGIAGQLMFTKYLEQNNIAFSSQEDRSKLMKEWLCEKQETIRQQSDAMHLCADWERSARFTLSDSFSNWVTQIFVKLFDAGYITRGTRLVYWDPKFQTALSDLEVDMIETQGAMYYIKYPGVDCDGITVATTRPETLFGDTAVAVHPDDPRYAHLVGKRVTVPIVNREVCIVGDTRCKQDKGTGAVKITPAHDFLDYAIGKDHALETIQVIDKDCKMIDCVLGGQDRFVARDNTINILRELELLEREESITHTTPRGNRGGAKLEVLPTAQWFCEMKELADCALAKLDEITIHPESQRKVLVSWLENIEPWCLSRQLWWGHRIPVWHNTADDKFFVAVDRESAMQQARAHYGKSVEIELTQDPDVLDTWFSSALWPFAIGEYHNNPITHEILTTGRDILNVWVARMIMLSIFHNGKVPFKEVLLTGLVRDSRGQKMSKTLGNVINPADVISKYGADATRLWLLSEVLPDKANVCISESTVALQSHFLTKVWNCARYCIANACDGFNGVVQHSWNRHWINRIKEIERSVANDWSEYKVASLYQTIYHGVWDEFANCYLEGAKAIWDAETSYVAHALMHKFLTLLHPLAPGITRELLQHVQCNALPQVDCDDNEMHNVTRWIQTAATIRSFATLAKIRDFTLQASCNVDTDILRSITGCTVRTYSDDTGLVQLINAPSGVVYISRDAANQATVGIKNKLNRTVEEIERNKITQQSFTDNTPSHIVNEKKNAIINLEQQRSQLEEYLARLQ